MLRQFKSRIGITAAAGLLAAGLGLGLLTGTGSAHAQQKEVDTGGDSCFLAGVNYPHGSLMVIYGMMHICKDGSWVIYTRPTLKASRTIVASGATLTAVHAGE